MTEQGVTRVNVSVPRDLKSRMDAVEQSVNWSRVAAEAFEKKLQELDSITKETATMDEVIARLKVAKGLEENEDFQEGFKAGEAWAKTKAKPKELERLTKYISDSSMCWYDCDDPAWMAPFGAPDYLVFAIWPRRRDDRQACEEFFEAALGNEPGDRVWDSDWLHGFGEGAVSIWDQVSDKLQ